MQIMKWLGAAAAIGLFIACFFPWVTIESKNIVVTGVNSTGTAFGKPGYFHFIMIAIYLPFLLINKIWSQRTNLFFSAMNIGWAVRNYFLISACQMGECPVKHTAIYTVVLTSVLMFVCNIAATPKGANFSSTS